MKLDDVLQQEGLQSAGKVASGRNLIALAAVAVLGLGGVGVLMSRSNPGPQSSTSTASSPQATPQPSPTQSGLDSRFAGTWTTEGDVQPTHSMNLVLKNPQKDKVEGVLQTAQRRGAGATSGYVTVVGRGQDSVADVILYNQRGNAIGNAQLRLEEQNLVWRLDAGSNEIFPIKATLHK